ncbi:MAG: tyrosine-type recombinase/integrase [Polyangiales bacterium]
MSRALPSRARRGEIGLVTLPSGAFAIRWGRSLSREAGLPLVESTQTQERREAQQILERRRLEVFRSLGDEDRTETARRRISPVQLDVLISDFLRDLRAGELPGRKPSNATVELYVSQLLGTKGGFLPFAGTMKRSISSQLDGVVVLRWLEAESRRGSNDTIRLKLIAVRRLAEYGAGRGVVTEEALRAIKQLRAPPSAKGRAIVDGVANEEEIQRLLLALSPPHWRSVAELQLRLGLRRSEVLVIQPTWLDERKGVVTVLVDESFDTKSHESRRIDGVDVVTFALAREVIALRARLALSRTGYREAWDRACRRLEKRGTPWSYRNKSHVLRSAYATMSRLANVPLSIVSKRLGHASERTTERHYLGRMNGPSVSPFAEVPRLVSSDAPAPTRANARPTRTK